MNEDVRLRLAHEVAIRNRNLGPTLVTCHAPDARVIVRCIGFNTKIQVKVMTVEAINGAIAAIRACSCSCSDHRLAAATAQFITVLTSALACQQNWTFLWNTCAKLSAPWRGDLSTVVLHLHWQTGAACGSYGMQLRWI